LPRPAIFFDRDGVLNVDAGYLFRPEDVRWMPGAVETVRRANELGFTTVVVTNQSGVARGMYSEADIHALHAWMQERFAAAGARMDAFYHCPHGPGDTCECRKPLPGMIRDAVRDLDIDPHGSFLIGDKQRDIDAAEAASIPGYLFEGPADLFDFTCSILVDRLRSACTVCVGDVMLDRFVYGEVSRISPEAPVPVLRVQREATMLGGAGNAARNIHALGGSVTLLSVAGDDAAGHEVERLSESPLVREAGRTTPTKTRYVAHGQQLLRADCETTVPLKPALADALLDRYRHGLSRAGAVLLSDYAKGVLAGPNASRFIDLALERGIPVVVDPKGKDFRRYRGATLLKPNLRELAEVAGHTVDTPESVEAAARDLIAEAELGNVLVTLGPEGMLLVPAGGEARTFPALAREVYDVTGAGDTVAAVLTAALAAGLPVQAAVEIANVAAGIVVGKTGTATASPDEITRLLRSARPQAAGSSVHDAP
jgi:rfaE bifunctional protein kinase chain/domain